MIVGRDEDGIQVVAQLGQDLLDTFAARRPGGHDGGRRNDLIGEELRSQQAGTIRCSVSGTIDHIPGTIFSRPGLAVQRSIRVIGSRTQWEAGGLP